MWLILVVKYKEITMKSVVKNILSDLSVVYKDIVICQVLWHYWTFSTHYNSAILSFTTMDSIIDNTLSNKQKFTLEGKNGNAVFSSITTLTMKFECL